MIAQPQPGEYPPFAAGYVSLVTGDVLAQLTRQRDASFDLFSRLPEERAGSPLAEDKWTVKEILGHMIDAERIFAYRALCIARGEKQSLPGFEQDDYVAQSGSNHRRITDMADEFRTLRDANLLFIKSLSDEQTARMGVANNRPASVRGLIYMMAGHELHHLTILNHYGL
jgi:uncharacterized damage-inducible protein DinB